LVDAADIVLANQRLPLSDAPKITKGSQPTDGGNLLLSSNEKTAFVMQEPLATQWLHPFVGAEEFINGIERWCLWLKGCTPEQLRKMPLVMKRVEAVRNMRLSSSKLDTVKWADMPTLFTEDRQPITPYLLIPSVSSEIRRYIPIGFVQPEVIASNLVLTVSDATLYHFGVLSSAMHMGWMRSVCGRLKSDYRYSAGIVYNNFPWPGNVTDKQRQSIEEAAQAVLDARAKYPGSSLADLYDPLSMPPELVKAHNKLDSAVDAAYSKKKFSGDSDRVAFLFELYQQLASTFATKPTHHGSKKDH